MRHLIRDVLAAGDPEADRYIMQWLAHLAQRPDENPGVALVFRGGEGTGKGTLGRSLIRMLKSHAIQITHLKHLLGPFNAHMRATLFVFADEAYFAGDRSAEGALKGLITEEFKINESKGRDASVGRNRIHLMMASNNSWVVPASADSRRFAVFDVSADHQQDHTYFARINEQMGSESHGRGVAAMLYDLRRLPLDEQLLRRPPATKALHEQRISSLRGAEKWLFDVLLRGSPLGNGEWPEHVTTDALVENYLEWSKQTRDPFPVDRHRVGQVLSAIFETYRPRSRTPTGFKVRLSAYKLGSLDDARRRFAELQGLGDPWPKDGSA